MILSSKNNITARKKHRCYLCGEDILPGEKYSRSNGISYGDFWSSAFHLECIAVTGYWDDGDWESFEPGSMERGKDEPKNLQRKPLLTFF